MVRRQRLGLSRAGADHVGHGGHPAILRALGVAKAPKVDFNPKALELSGAVGKKIEASIEVATTEKKVVYGWATCDKTWVEVGKTKLAGKTAIIPITIRIPKPCPPTLEATLQVMGNGNQKLTVPLKVAVAGGKTGSEARRGFRHPGADRGRRNAGDARDH